MQTLLINICDDSQMQNDIDKDRDTDRINVSTLNELKEYLKSNNINSKEYACLIEPIYFDYEYSSQTKEEFDKNVDQIITYLKNDSVECAIYFEDYTLDAVIEYLDKFSKYKDLKYLINENHYKPVTYKELVIINNYVNLIANYVKRFNFSPFEQTLFLTDLIKELKYKKYPSTNQSISRDLIEIIRNDFIVCEGYANIFKAVLDKLGIGSVVSLYYHDEIKNIPENQRNNGHATVSAFIDDDKYNIHHQYAYDLTWGSNDGTDSYLENYKYIAIPKELDNKIKNLIKGYDGKFMFLKNESEIIKDRIDEFKTLIDLNGPDFILNNVYLKLVEKISPYGIKPGAKSFDLFLKEKETDFLNLTYEQKHNYLLEYYNLYIKNHINEIPISVFIEALYNVKRVENSINKEKYSESFNNIKEIVFNRTKFLESIKTANSIKDVDLKQVSKEEVLLSAIFGKELYPKWYEQEYNKALTNIINKNKELYGNDLESRNLIARDQKMMHLLSAFRKASGEDTLNPVKKGRTIK